MTSFNPFNCKSETNRHLSIALTAIATLAWVAWVGVVTHGFSKVHLMGWAVFFGAPVAVYVALLAALPVAQRATKDVRYLLSVCIMWLFVIATWGCVWDWESVFMLEQYVALFVFPPVGACVGFLLWRWSTAAGQDG